MDNKNHRPPVTHYNKTKNGLKIAVWNARKKKHQSLTFYQVRDLFFACVFLKVQTASFSISYIRFAEKIDDKLNEKRDIVRICENHPVNKLEGLGEIYWPHTISMGSFPMIDIITLMYFCAGRFALSILGTNAGIFKKKKKTFLLLNGCTVCGARRPPQPRLRNKNFYWTTTEETVYE